MKYSGRFVLRISPELHKSLREQSAQQEKSLNEYCLEKLKGAPSREPSIRAEEEGWISQLRDWLKKDLLGVVLFGSFARGEATQESDRDYLIVVSDQLKLSPALYQEWDQRVAKKVPEIFSPHFTHLPTDVDEAGGLWFEVALDGIIFFDHDGNVLRLLQGLRREMAEGRIVRKAVKGQPYWVRENQTGSEEDAK